MNRVKWLFGIGAVLGLLLLAASCNRPAVISSGPPLELRSYTVPAEYASEVNSVINSLLPNTRAKIGPGGVLLVAAPASVQKGVQEMLDDLAKNRPGPPPVVSLTYWAVVGRPAKEPSWPSSLNEIAPALKAVSASETALSFSLLQRLTLPSLSGERATLSGGRLTIKQVATARQDGVLAQIDLNLVSVSAGRSSSSLTTKVQIGLDKLLVLGQAGLLGEGESQGGVEASVFYIVRARVEP